MIFEGLFSILVVAATGVLGLFPTGASPQHAIDLVVQGYGFFNRFLPVGESLTAFGIILGTAATLGLARAGIYALTKVHVLGGQ